MYKKAVILLLMLHLSLQKKRPFLFSMTHEDPVHQTTTNYKTDHNGNNFKIKFENQNLMEDNKMYLLLESTNPDFYIALLKPGAEQARGSNIIMDLVTSTGNIMMIMSDKYFNNHLKFVKENLELNFAVMNRDATAQDQSFDYTIKVMVQEQAHLDFNKTYTTRVDFSLTEFQLLMTYKGEEHPDLYKLRFQLNTIKKSEDYSVSAKLINTNGATYILNEVYKNMVGGMIDKNNFPLCTKTGDCSYTLKVKTKGVKVFNILAKVSPKIEVLSILTEGEQYERTFEKHTTRYFKLPYIADAEGLDYSVTLRPSTAGTSLYVNPQTKPTSLESWAWSEQGHLGKRITIRWDDLKEMKAHESDLYIAVRQEQHGEYFLKVDAHESSIRGQLNHGVVEAGYVKYNEIVNYLYTFQVYKSQDIEFKLGMNVISGKADLYLKQCTDFANCMFTDSTLNGVEIQNDTSHSNQEITKKFTCEVNRKQKMQGSNCLFAIGIRGQEDRGSHYDVSLHETRFHKQMTPGYTTTINLQPGEESHVKFSFPSKMHYDSDLIMQLDQIYGGFVVYGDKDQEYPTEKSNKLKLEFISTQHTHNHAMRSVNLTNMIEKEHFDRVEGIYYATIQSATGCSMKIKFYESSSTGIVIHTLNAGEMQKGSISKPGQVVYYSIKAHLSKEQASSVQVTLTPTDSGKFKILASKKGKIPTSNDNDDESKNNHLDISYDDYVEQEEHIIGVMLNQDNNEREYKFTISFSYSNKPLVLKPGVLSDYILKPENQFLIEVTQNMASVLILKSITDGFNLQVCTIFSGTGSKPNDLQLDSNKQIENCPNKESKDKNVSVYYSEDELKRNCDKVRNNKKCYILLLITGTQSQKVTLGYTFNDHAFKLIPGTMINGPKLMDISSHLNFVMDVDINSPFGLYFNSKGLNCDIYTKMISFEDSKNKHPVFPNKSSHDEKHRQKRGQITSISYSKNELANYGQRPEIYISLRTRKGKSKNSSQKYDGNYSFVLSSIQQSKNILRMETHKELLQANVPYFYHFYNNSNNQVLKININGYGDNVIDVMLSRNKDSIPLINSSYLIKKSGIGRINLNLSATDLKEFGQKGSDQEILQGHYTIQVVSKAKQFVNIFWNNTMNLNYTELTPGAPTTITSDSDRKLYFSFQVDNPDLVRENSKIRIYMSSSVQASMYISNNEEGDLLAPSKDSAQFTKHLSHRGGIAMLEIEPSDPNYCVNCLYVGYFKTSVEAQVKLLVDIEHLGEPIQLMENFTFPERIPSDGERRYRIYNSDTSRMDLSFAVQSGDLEIFLGKTADFQTKDAVIHEKIDFQKQNYKYVIVKPSDFDMSSPGDYFLLLRNPKATATVLNITVIQNTSRVELIDGIRKHFTMGQEESADFYAMVQPSQKEIEIHLRLTGIHDLEYLSRTTRKLYKGDIFKILIGGSDESEYPVDFKIQSAHDKSIYLKVDLKDIREEKYFIFRVNNPYKTTVDYEIEMLTGGYQFVTIGQYNVNKIEGKNAFKVFEVFGHKDDFLFNDIRKCTGDYEVSFHESDIAKVEANDFMKTKDIRDPNSLVKYTRLEHERLFIKVQNKGDTELSIFNLNVFHEKHLDQNPYSEISEGNDGRVLFNTSSFVINFDSIALKSTYSEEYFHEITYHAYLSDKLDNIRFAKNCGRQFFDFKYPKENLHVFTKKVSVYDLKDLKLDKNAKLEMHLPDLAGSHKYYGILIAQINLYESGSRSLKPIKSAYAYYDEFIVVTPRFQFPFKTIIGSVIAFGILSILFLIVKNFVFGDLGKFDQFEKLTDLTRIENSVFGFDAVSILEAGYMQDKPAEDLMTMDSNENSHDFELSMEGDDKNTPLDIEE